MIMYDPTESASPDSGPNIGIEQRNESGADHNTDLIVVPAQSGNSIVMDRVEGLGNRAQTKEREVECQPILSNLYELSRFIEETNRTA